MLSGTTYPDFRTDFSLPGELVDESLMEDFEEVGSSNGLNGIRLLWVVAGLSHQRPFFCSTGAFFFESDPSALLPSSWMMPLRI